MITFVDEGTRWAGKCRRLALAFVLTIASPASASAASAQTSTAPAKASAAYVELILDASGSMYGRLPSGAARITAAKDVLVNFISQLPTDPALHVGLRIYGATLAASAADACKDTKLVLPLKGLDRTALQRAVTNARPKGATPIALSLQQAAADFPREASRKLVVLVTDGQESCRGDVRAAWTAFKAQGIDIDLRIVGIDLDKNAQATFAGIGTFENARSTVELATALGRATASVAAPAVTKLPVTVVLTSNGKPLTGAAKVSFASPVDAKAVTAFVPGTAGYTAQLPAGTYAAIVETTEAGVQTFGGLSVSAGAGNRFTFEVGKVAPVRLEFTPVQPVAGGRLTFTYSGAPAGDRNWVTVALKSDADTAYLDYQTVKGAAGTGELGVPDDEAPHELRYHLANADGSTRVIGRSAQFTPKRIAASLSAPDTALAGSAIEVRWTGPNNPGDYVTVVKAGAPVGTFGNYVYTNTGNPVKLTMPIEAGSYELRYSSESTTPNPTRASRPISLKTAAYALDAPATAAWGSTIDVRWTGPNNKGDYITIVKAGAPVGTYTKYVYTNTGNPVKFLLPAEPGAYELRYLSEVTNPNPTLTSRPITIVGGTYSLQAPASAASGSVVEIRWTGPKEAPEYITIVKAGAPEGTFGTYVYTRDGNPARLTMPEEPGSYEIRYMSEAKSPNPTLAKASITITARK